MSKDYLFNFNRRVTPAFRELVLRMFPAAAANSGHLRMIAYLLFSTFIDEKDADRLVLTQRMLWMNIYPNAQGNKSAAKIREEFELATGIDLDTREGDAYGTFAATVRPDLPEALLRAKRDLQGLDLKDRTIYFMTGQQVNDWNTRRHREDSTEEKREAVETALETLDRPCHTDLEFLNDQANAARMLTRALPKTKGLVDVTQSSGPMAARLLDYALNVIDASIDDPRITYAPTKNAPRVFPKSASILQMPRSFRRLTLSLCEEDGGHILECDLTYAHLAIVAKCWGDLPETNALLARARETGNSVWQEFLIYLGLDHSYKPILKKTLYSLIYGMARNNNNTDANGVKKVSLRKQFLEGVPSGLVPIKGIPDPKLWTKFAKHPVIAELLLARGREIAQIVTDGGRYDAWGSWIDTKNEQGEINAKSILSYVSQSYEQKMMGALLEALKRRKQVYVLAYLHDGITIASSDPAKTSGHIKAIKSAVAKSAEEMGILTSLDVEYLDADEMLKTVAQTLDELSTEEVLSIAA